MRGDGGDGDGHGEDGGEELHLEDLFVCLCVGGWVETTVMVVRGMEDGECLIDVW